MPTIKLVSDWELSDIITSNKDSFDELTDLHNSITPITRPTYKNLVSVAKTCKTILQIGLKNGISTLFMLLSNPDVHVHIVDKNPIKYDYLQSIFPNRLSITRNNPIQAIENLDSKPYDLYYVDEQEYNKANIIFFMCQTHGKNESLIVFKNLYKKDFFNLWTGYIKNLEIKPLRLLSENYSTGYGIIVKNNYDIIVCTMALGEKYKHIVRYGQKRLKSYCEKYEYDFTDEELYDDSRPPAWSKVRLIQKCLQNDKHDYVVWIDADTLIMNDEITISSLIDKLANNKDITMAQDWVSINSGVMFIKNTEWSKMFFKELYDQTDFINHNNWEQSALIHMYDNNMFDSRDHINVLPLDKQTLINSYWFNYHVGDFLLHFPGSYRLGDNKGLDIWMNKYCPIRMDEDTNESYNGRLEWLKGECLIDAKNRLDYYNRQQKMK